MIVFLRYIRHAIAEDFKHFIKAISSFPRTMMRILKKPRIWSWIVLFSIIIIGGINIFLKTDILRELILWLLILEVFVILWLEYKKGKWRKWAKDEGLIKTGIEQ